MTTYIIRTTEFVEKEYIIETADEECLENYFKGKTSFGIDIIDETLISANTKAWKIVEVDND